MATTIKIRGDSNSDEPVVLVGRAQRPLTRITSLIRSRVTREVVLPIENVSEQPDVTFTGNLVAPSQLQQSQSVQLSAELFSQIPGGPLNLVEDYDPTHWNKTITSGGSSASLGGPNGDLLTATTTTGAVVVEFVYNVPGSEAEGTEAVATVQVVASPTFTVTLLNLPSNVIQGLSYTLGAERRDSVSGQVVDNDPANFAFTITSGGTFASITNGNQLNVNPGTSGNSITVRATHTAGEFGQGTANIIVQPAFPNNEPSGFNQLVLVNGSTKNWPGFVNNSADWVDANRIVTVADAESKYGNATEKRFFIGDQSGWNGFNTYAPTSLFDEVYCRIVLKFSSNWDPHAGGEKILVNRRNLNGKRAVGPDFHIRSGTIATVYVAASLRLPGAPIPSGIGTSTALIVPGSPTYDGNLSWNGPFAKVNRTQYFTLETIRRANSAPGVFDGSLRVWVNDVEHTRFSVIGGPSQYYDFAANAIEWIGPSDGSSDPPRISPSIQAPLFWGGQNDTKTVNDWVRVSEIYISARNL